LEHYLINTHHLHYTELRGKQWQPVQPTHQFIVRL
jgi:hypothetical protein